MPSNKSVYVGNSRSWGWESSLEPAYGVPPLKVCDDLSSGKSLGFGENDSN